MLDLVENQKETTSSHIDIRFLRGNEEIFLPYRRPWFFRRTMEEREEGGRERGEKNLFYFWQNFELIIVGWREGGPINRTNSMWFQLPLLLFSLLFVSRRSILKLIKNPEVEDNYDGWIRRFEVNGHTTKDWKLIGHGWIRSRFDSPSTQYP